MDPNEEMMHLSMRPVGQKLECQHCGLRWRRCTHPDIVGKGGGVEPAELLGSF